MKLCVRQPNVLEVKERARGPLSPCQVWWGSDFEFFCLSVCLFVCLSVHHAFERQSLCAGRLWSTETILMPLGRGRFVVVHPCSTFSDCRPLSTLLNSEVQKSAKIGFFPAWGWQNKPSMLSMNGAFVPIFSGDHSAGIETSGYVTWFTAGGAIRIAHYDVIDDVITRKL